MTWQTPPIPPKSESLPPVSGLSGELMGAVHMLIRRSFAVWFDDASTSVSHWGLQGPHLMDFSWCHICVGVKVNFSNNKNLVVWVLHAPFSLYALGHAYVNINIIKEKFSQRFTQAQWDFAGPLQLRCLSWLNLFISCACAFICLYSSSSSHT